VYLDCDATQYSCNTDHEQSTSDGHSKYKDSSQTHLFSGYSDRDCGWQQNSRWLACSICSCHFTCPAEHMVHCSSVQCVMACWVASASLTQFLHCTFCVKYFLQPEIVLSHILKTVLCMQILHVLACSDSPQNAWHYHGGSCLSTCRKFCNCDYDFC